MKDLRFLEKAELRALNVGGEKPDQQQDPNQQQNQDNQDPDSKDQDQPKGKTKAISGYALKFNTPSKDLGGFVEQIDPQALQGVDLSNVIMLSDHDYSKPVASVKAGTLKLNVDDQGLAFTANIDTSVSYASDLYNNVQNGNVDSMSFRFDVDDGGDEFQQDDSGKVVRTIKKLKDLFEISSVTVPAYDSSNVQVDKRSYEDFLNSINKDNEVNNNMDKTIIKPEPSKEETEVRSFEDYIRSHGEKRDGLSTEVGGQPIIPSEIVSPIFESKVGANDLSKYVTIKSVTTGQGNYPIASNDPSKILATKEELAQIGDVDAGITSVPFAVKTRAGKIYLSSELLDDSAIDFKKEIQQQLQKLVTNTDNNEILGLLAKLPKQVAKSLDDVKQLKNTKLDPSLAPIVVVNQSGYNWLDTLKDDEGRYILQPDQDSATGKMLFGLQVVEMPDSILPNVAAGQFPIYVGDLTETIALFRRNNVAVSWQQFNSFSEGLAVVARSDYEFINQDATVAITLDSGAAATTTTTTTSK